MKSNENTISFEQKLEVHNLMARIEKYYGTMFIGFYIPEEILNKYNATNRHNQFRMVCKAKSRAEANRIIQNILKTTSEIFSPNYSSETGNQKELESADQHMAIMALDNRDIYYSIQQIYDEVQECRNQIK